MNPRYPSSVARNAAVILAHLAGRLVVIYLNIQMTQRILAIYYPNALTSWRGMFDPLEQNMLLIWDAHRGCAHWLQLEQETHIVAGGKTYRVQLAGQPLPSPSLFHMTQMIS